MLIMKNSTNDYERKTGLLLKALKWLSRDKIKAIKHKEEHLRKVVCIYSTIDHLAEIERRSRKRRKVNAMEGQHKRQRLDEEKTPYKQEVDEMFNVTI